MISSKSPCTAMIILISGFIPLVALAEKKKKEKKTSSSSIKMHHLVLSKAFSKKVLIFFFFFFSALKLWNYSTAQTQGMPVSLSVHISQILLAQW